jgi:hypothetical protein
MSDNGVRAAGIIERIMIILIKGIRCEVYGKSEDKKIRR